VLDRSSISTYYEAARPLLSCLINTIALKECKITLTSYSEKFLITFSVRRLMPLISLIIIIYV
jgi:hypothetical protein